MPKPFGMTARGRITHRLRVEKGATQFSPKELAKEYNTTASNVIRLLKELEANNWKIRRFRSADRTFFYDATPPTKT